MSKTLQLTLRGISPVDECVERIESSFLDMQEREYEPTELDVGRQYKIVTSLIIKDEYLEAYGLKSNRLKVNGLPLHVFLDGEDRPDLYQYDTLQRYITFYKPCAGEFTIKYRKATNYTYFDDVIEGSSINKTFAIRAAEDPAYRYKPTKALKPNVGKYDAETGEYVVTFAPQDKTKEIYGSTSEKDVNPMCHIVFCDEESESVARVDSRICVYRKVNRGVCNVELVSVFDDSLRTKVRIVFEGYIPEEMKIAGNRTLLPTQEMKYAVEFKYDLMNEKQVTWSIVEGEDIASLEGSKLTARRLGKVVLRAESAYFPGLSEEVEIEIALFNNLYSFVRKVIGHFTMFAFLGLGYAACLFFFMKKRWTAFVLAPMGVFAMAAWTELIQFYTPGRTGYIYDVLINFGGGMVGVIVFAVCILTYLLVTLLLAPKKLGYIKTELPKLSFQEVFKRTPEPIVREEEKKDEKLKSLPDQGNAQVVVLRFDGEVRESD